MISRELERVPQGELQNARVARRLNAAEIAIVQQHNGLPEIDRIEEIEKLASELDLAEAFGDRKTLHERDISGSRRRTAENVASKVSIAPGLIGGESRGIEKCVDEVVTARVLAEGDADEVWPVPTD